MLKRTARGGFLGGRSAIEACVSDRHSPKEVIEHGPAYKDGGGEDLPSHPTARPTPP